VYSYQLIVDLVHRRSDTSPTRVVQAALKLVLEPIFEADFEPVS
jgi:retron-type reverse transcriptase